MLTFGARDLFVGFSDDRRVEVVVRFGVALFIFGLIIIVVGISRRHDHLGVLDSRSRSRSGEQQEREAANAFQASSPLLQYLIFGTDRGRDRTGDLRIMIPLVRHDNPMISSARNQQ